MFGSIESKLCTVDSLRFGPHSYLSIKERKLLLEVKRQDVVWPSGKSAGLVIRMPELKFRLYHLLDLFSVVLSSNPWPHLRSTGSSLTLLKVPFETPHNSRG